VKPTLVPRRPTALLAASDALAIVVFATVGLISHDHTLGATGYARDALPILLAWFAVALPLRLYATQQWWRLVTTWAIAVPAAILVRALILGRSLDGREATFLCVALASTLVFVAVGRSLIALTPPAERGAQEESA